MALLAAASARADYTNLHSFAGGNNDGAEPYGSLLLSGSTLYGMTSTGGSNNLGVAFKINTDGTGYTNLHSFAGGTSDGSTPSDPLILSGSTLYGPMVSGGTYGGGTLFKVNTDGTGYTILHNFGDPGNGTVPNCLILSDDTLYGMTGYGLNNMVATLFQINTNGNGFTTLCYFTTGLSYPSGMILSDSTFYGTIGGTVGYAGGVLYKIGTDGTGYTPLYNFGIYTNIPGRGSYPDGLYLTGNPILSGSNLYGMTYEGGSDSNSMGVVFKININGTGHTNLHSFDGGSSDGAYVHGSLLLSGSTLYGMTVAGGSTNKGVVFQMNTDGSGFTNLHSFTGGSNDGAYPHGSLILSGSTLYGMTSAGGSTNKGVVFALSLCTYAFATTSTNVAATAGTGSAGVITSNGCSWTATTNQSWLLTSSSGTGPGTVNYTWDGNPGAARTGTVSVADQVFTVVQAANAPPQIHISSVTPVTLPVTNVNLNATVTDDGAPNGTLITTWSQVSGPGTVTFGDASATNTTATLSTNGVYVLRLMATDGAATNSDDVSVIVNASPVIVTPPTATNAVTVVGGMPIVLPGEAVTFVVVATDPDENPLTYAWSFGDGATSTNTAPSHVFSNCGPYTVMVEISDSHVTVSNSFVVSVACAFIEPMKLTMKSNSVTNKQDSASLKTSINLPPGFSVTNVPVTLDIGGATVPFVLGSKGNSVSGVSTFKLSHKGKATSTVWRVTATLKGDWDSDWVNDGLVNATTNITVIVPVTLLVDTPEPESFFTNKSLLYKAKAGKAGSAK